MRWQSAQDRGTEFKCERRKVIREQGATSATAAIDRAIVAIDRICKLVASVGDSSWGRR